MYGSAVPYRVHTIVETPAYLADAKHEHMTSDEREAAVDLVAANPEAGDLIVGSGGCRKVRIGGKEKASRVAIALSPSLAERTCPCF
jgi:hypothetical protein